MKNIVTRFPPSPTGFLHVGNLRTALYNYLFAKHHGGKLILRIEDTDRSRYVEGAVEKLIRTLETLGIKYDEGPVLLGDEIQEVGESGPYFQSNRLEIYKEHAQRLLDENQAYYCFCSSERLEKLRKEQTLSKMPTKYDRTCLKLSEAQVKEKLEAKEQFVVRMKIPEGETTFTDIIRGKITISHTEIDDQVILKSDGFPTYHLAVVVDDHLMGVTHIIRGEEWLSSVPKHVLLYKAFDYELPELAHLPLILNPDKSKLSKRQGDVAVEDFLNKGYLSEALVNFMALLGWNPKSDQEIYSLSELVNSFDLTKVNKGGAVFNLEKLNWMNSQYLQQKSSKELLPLAKEILIGQGYEIDESLLEKILEVEKSRLNNLSELTDNLGMYQVQPDFEKELLVWKKSDLDGAKSSLEAVKTFLSSLEETDWSIEYIEEQLKAFIEDKGLSNGEVLWPLRVALSGKKNSPGPFELLYVLGKEEGIKRVEKALTML